MQLLRNHKSSRLLLGSLCSALVLATGLLFTGCATTGKNAPSQKAEMKTPVQVAKTFHYTKTTNAELNYLLYLPEGYSAKAAKKWPLILFLHGAGERGSNVWKVATHGPAKLATNHFPMPFVVVSPQCPNGQIWSNETLLGLLDAVIKEHAIDTNRVYLTGLSMGGFGTWRLGLAYPERFAAIAPICGGGDMISALLASGERANALRTLGIWAFHGAKDPVVPLSESQRMVDLVKRAGVKDVQLTVYPEAQHDSWTVTYENPEFYTWLLNHHR